MDAEDFERAADLSARLDSLNASVSRLANDLRAAEAECELTSALSHWCWTRRVQAILVVTDIYLHIRLMCMCFVASSLATVGMQVLCA